MTKKELINALIEKTGATKKDTEMHINAFIEVVGETLGKGEDIRLIGFGTFEVRERKARKGRNPRNPDEVIDIPASKAPAFKAGKSLRDIVNK